MPIYQIDIEKRAQGGASTGEYWTNRYLVDALNLDDAATAAAYYTDIERAIHTPAALFTKRSVRDTNPATDLYRTTPINLLGSYGGSAPSDMLPAMLVVRVDLAVATGRPSRKYYHLLTGEGTQANGAWSNELLTDVNSNVTSLIGGTPVATLCDPQGTPILSGAALPTVTVHQFRRGSKRKLVPILT